MRSRSIVLVDVSEPYRGALEKRAAARELEVTEAIIWRSDNTAVVGIDFNGLATGISAGETEVTGRWQGRADGAIVTVTP